MNKYKYEYLVAYQFKTNTNEIGFGNSCISRSVPINSGEEVRAVERFISTESIGIVQVAILNFQLLNNKGA